MLAEKDTETLFSVLDKSTEILKNELSISFLDAFIETGDNILNSNQVHIENGQPSESTVSKLEKLYNEIDYNSMDAESIRKAIQIIMIKATKEDAVQANHQITPDTIASIMGYLIIRLYNGKPNINILDLSVGTGNLLSTVMNQLTDEIKTKVHGVGVDNDDSMLAIASLNFQMQNKTDNMDLIHQDSVDNLFVDDSDLVISDLPVGYYPIDENTKNYKTRSKDGHSYAHHLLIEQGMNHVKPNGFGVFLVPSNLFNTPAAKELLKWIQDNAYMQGLLNLPKELFANSNAQKAILILQKHGDQAKQADKIMLGEFPSFKNPSAFQKYLAEIVEWEENNLLK
ncbi:class I SAM-dependent methyltransferase [Apilactobacillus apisilvae]|uniref:Class I SAM-dependent methyltransferase n=1 Tax=Apilactobacillus apisilvae TaxID=2923364 RepID=A0ABY4PJU9_9LACO|nr:class I SAM-dependent methyltransferase [Apilactobacillus apisilvae]UQS85701.1 class I SAM-dependent methyltransferase [Apilactobacillus apisilvae]